MHESTRNKIYNALDKWHWRTFKQIAELSGLSTRTLYRNLHDLAHRGEISVSTPRGIYPARFAFKLPRIVYAAEYGNDEFGDGSIDMPFCTITRANKGLGAGDQIRVLINRRLTTEELPHV